MKIEKARYQTISSLKNIPAPPNIKRYQEFQAFETYKCSQGQHSNNKFYEQLLTKCKEQIITDYNLQIYSQIKDELRQEEFMIDQAIQIQNNYINQINIQISFYQSLKNTSTVLSDTKKLDFKAPSNISTYPIQKAQLKQHYQPQSAPKNLEVISKLNQKNALQKTKKMMILNTVQLYHFENSSINNIKSLITTQPYQVKKQRPNSVYNEYLLLEQAVSYLQFLKRQMKQKKVTRQYYLQEKTKIKYKIEKLKKAIQLKKDTILSNDF